MCTGYLRVYNIKKKEHKKNIEKKVTKKDNIRWDWEKSTGRCLCYIEYIRREKNNT